MQSSSSSRVFNPTLAGASPATDAICSQGVISSARRSAKAEVRGANPRESTIFNGDHDVTAASRPVKAFVPVRIRLVTPISGDAAARRLQPGTFVVTLLNDIAGDRPQSSKPELRVYISLQDIKGKVVRSAECPDYQCQEQCSLESGRFHPKQPRRSQRDDEEENSFQPDQLRATQICHSYGILVRRCDGINPIARGGRGGDPGHAQFSIWIRPAAIQQFAGMVLRMG